jgi:hypothetical protein
MAEIHTEMIKRQDKSLPSIFARLTDELTQVVDARLELFQGECNFTESNTKRKDDLALGLKKKLLKLTPADHLESYVRLAQTGVTSNRINKGHENSKREA